MTASTRLMWPRCSRQGFVKGIQFRGLRRLFTTDWAAAWQASHLSALHHHHSGVAAIPAVDHTMFAAFMHPTPLL